MGGRKGLRRLAAAVTAVAALSSLVLWIVGGRADASSAAPSYSWALNQLRAPDAWPVSRGDGITIGVVDTGVDPRSSALAGRVVAAADCVSVVPTTDGTCRTGDAPDAVGHGTVVAGVAAAVAPGAKFVVARAVGASRIGYDSDVAAGIDWAVAHGAKVVNVSLADEDAGGVVMSPRIAEAAERAWAKGVVPVLAAGNLGGSTSYGAVDALVAGATTPNGTLASYSNRPDQSKWGLAAPGSVSSTLPSGTIVTHTGTSIAAPNVAGAAALLLAHGTAADAAVQRLVSTAVPCAGCGHGRVDVAAALGVQRAPAPPPTVPQKPVAAPVADPVVPDPSLLERAPAVDALRP